MCSKFTGKHPCRSLISINLFCYFIEITIRHGCCPVNLLHIFRRPFYNNTSGGLFLAKKTAIFICISGCSTGLVSKSISGSLKIKYFFQQIGASRTCCPESRNRRKFSSFIFFSNTNMLNDFSDFVRLQFFHIHKK